MTMKTESLLQSIARDFPQLQWREHRVLTHGWDHVVIVLDERIVFRFPKEKGYRDRVQSEIELLEYLRKRLNVGIPEYTYVSRDGSFAGYAMLHGRELTRSRFRRLSASERGIVAGQLAGFISALHATPKSIIDKHGISGKNQVELYEELVCSTKKFLFPRFREKDIQCTEEYLSDLKDALSHDYSNVLVHNDLAPEHILWEHKVKQINIIDFSDRVFGDPAIDLSELLEYGPRFVERVLKLYSGEKDDQILKRAHLYFRRTPLWIMKDSMDGLPCTFEQGYAMFKQRFRA
jgi:aminoglycoside 2''-phosphotransferase